MKRAGYTTDGKGNITSERFVLAGKQGSEVPHVPDPAKIARISTLYGPDGDVRAQWIIEKPEDAERIRNMQEWARAMAEPLPRAEPVECYYLPEHSQNLMACYPIGDHHMGMLSWDKETGSDYDLDIAEQLLGRAITHLVGTTPPCDRAAVVFLGDFMHYDSFDAVTPTSRNMLDSDGRYPKMVRAAIRTMRHTIETVAARHRAVLVIVEIGNHDLASSIFLMECLNNIYEENPRITVDTNPSHFHYFSFGKNLIGTHHGHGAKYTALPGIMAHDRAVEWGQTEHRAWWTGHIHTQKVFDFPGCSVESFRVLPPSDAWAHNKGYRAARDMKAVVLHHEYGEVARYTVNPSMLES